jgi:small subunit ribosomal protein S19
MGRSAWKGPYVAVSLLKDVIAVARQHPEWWNKTRFQGAPAPAVIKTQSRASVILPDFLRCVFFVHNGNKRMVRLEVSENMVGHKFGEFAPTRKVGWLSQCGCGSVRGRGCLQGMYWTSTNIDSLRTYQTCSMLVATTHAAAVATQQPDPVRAAVLCVLLCSCHSTNQRARSRQPCRTRVQQAVRQCFSSSCS